MTKFKFHKLKTPKLLPPKKAMEGDVYDCFDLQRKFICYGTYWLVRSRIYIGKLIKIDRHIGDKLLKNKFYRVYHTFFIK